MIESKINLINEFVKQKPWFDFELIELVNKNLKIIGSTDFSYFHELEITFLDIFFIQCPETWKSDTSKDIIVIPSIEEQRSLNQAYEIEQGYQLVKIIPEDIAPIYISCKYINVNSEKKLYTI